MQTQNPFLDEMAKLSTAAMGLAAAAGEEAKAAFRAQADRMAAELGKAAGPDQVKCLRPVQGKDWNDELKRADRSAPAERFDLASRLQLELERQKKVRAKDHSLGR